jgi:nitrogen fixation/metabolism regulation signal transduction histidine kinase
MKSVRTHSQFSIISVRGLLFIYVLLVILIFLLSNSFFADPTGVTRNPGMINLVIFWTIPVVLLVFFAVSIFYFVKDLFSHYQGSRFKMRILTYFIITAMLATAPSIIITIQFFYQFTRIWGNMHSEEALQYGQDFALDYYHLRIENLGELARNEKINFILYPNENLLQEDNKINLQSIDEGLLSVQDFILHQPIQDENSEWISPAFTGDENYKLKEPPRAEAGYVPREIPRDTDIIRYIFYPDESTLRIVSFDLGEGFDDKVETISKEKRYFETLTFVQNNINLLLIFFYGVFFMPTLLMTLIIALSLTRLVTQPFIELADATNKLADGDYSIQILTTPKDELGFLINSFNSMVLNLEKSQAALLKTEKQSIWQSMAQQLAHEIKNPLTPIRLSAERVLRRWKNEPERIDEIIESSMLAIIQEVESLSGLLNEFRTLSKPIEPSLSWINIKEQIEEVISPYKMSHPHIEFHIDHIDPEISIKIDKKHFFQILTNLIINAIDAMDSKGIIDIRTDLVKKRDSRYCRMSVKDFGKGIPEDKQDQLFTPYFTTKDSGTGLGLPIVERIVSDHGGSIWFNSAPGAGTTFFIDLPSDVNPLSINPKETNPAE